MTLGNGIILVGEKDTFTRLYYEPRASQAALLVKNPPANAGDIRDAGSILGSGRSPGGGHGNPLQPSFMENPPHMNRGAYQATVHRVTNSWVQLK